MRENNKAVEMLTFFGESWLHQYQQRPASAKQPSFSVARYFNNPAFPPVPGFVLGAATKLNGKVDGASNIFTELGRSKGEK